MEPPPAAIQPTAPAVTPVTPVNPFAMQHTSVSSNLRVYVTCYVTICTLYFIKGTFALRMTRVSSQNVSKLHQTVKFFIVLYRAAENDVTT